MIKNVPLSIDLSMFPSLNTGATLGEKTRERRLRKLTEMIDSGPRPGPPCSTGQFACTRWGGTKSQWWTWRTATLWSLGRMWRRKSWSWRRRSGRGWPGSGTRSRVLRSLSTKRRVSFDLQCTNDYFNLKCIAIFMKLNENILFTFFRRNGRAENQGSTLWVSSYIYLTLSIWQHCDPWHRLQSKQRKIAYTIE